MSTTPERAKVAGIVQRARSTVLARVARTVSAHRMFSSGTRVLVAVSGGPDSVGLLAILAALRRKLGLELVAAHVNHGLRGADSDADQECATAAAERAGVPFVSAHLPATLRASANLEAHARELRYRALHRLAATAGCTRIATGHTRDDQAETVLLRLIRGSGIGGLAGVEPVRDDGVVRPVIDCARREVEAFVRASAFAYRIDTSNRDPRFLRTRVRHSLMPLLLELNPGMVDRLVTVATLSSAERTIVQAWTGDQLRLLQHGEELDIARLRALPADTHRHLIRAWLLRIGVPAAGLGARNVDLVARLALGAPSGQVELRDTVIARRYDRLMRPGGAPRATQRACTLHPGVVAEFAGGWRIEVDPIRPQRKGMRLHGDLWTAVCDATTLSETLVLRAPRVGERVRPFGLGGRHRKLSDLFIDRKIPAADRKIYPIISYGEEVLWVPGVVRSDLLRVGEQTKGVLRLRARRGNDERARQRR